MKDIRTLLRAGDPVAHEPGLPPEAVADLRRAVLGAARATPGRPVLWGRQLAVAAGLTMMVLTGLVVAHRVPSAVRDVPPPITPPVSAKRMQVQFSTPGGTRIIWTLDPAFHIKEAQQ